MAEWWVNSSGTNNLKGVEDDDDNPILLDDDTIVEFLQRIPEARASFDRLYPSMLDDEKERLDELARVAQRMIVDDTDASDIVQRRANRAGVRRGGGFMPPPIVDP